MDPLVRPPLHSYSRSRTVEAQSTMRFFLVVLALLASASSTAALEACAGLQLLNILGICLCVDLFGHKSSLSPGCTAKPVGLLGKCEATCTPTPSHHPKAKRNMPILLADGTLQRCPAQMTACPIDIPPSLNGNRATATISANEPYECVKPEEDLYNCGGCSSTGQGVSCGDLPGVRGTSCTEGKCTIYSCRKGYILTINPNGTEECVVKSPRRI
ncbi:hypothetical protein BDV93DRAFT_526273 [Ceratobasidium sp. AG-I]|nr:hypothetical protein BDV93DRAFT_526273 [Ceratobasidium sp. AG-I]